MPTASRPRQTTAFSSSATSASTGLSSTASKPATGAATRHGRDCSIARLHYAISYILKPQAYVVNELTSSVASFAFDAQNGQFEVLDIAPTLPGSTTGNYCSEIRISGDGHTLYIANRVDK